MAYMKQNLVTRGRRGGVAGYQNVGRWDWEFYPPPYDWLAPKNSAPQPAPILGGRGMGCACSGSCGGGGCNKGMGLFDTPFDVSTWGMQEWAIAGIGAYLLISLLGDLKGAKKRVVRYQRKSARRAALKEQLKAA